jgi:hypothetical protein
MHHAVVMGAEQKDVTEKIIELNREITNEQKSDIDKILSKPFYTGKTLKIGNQSATVKVEEFGNLFIDINNKDLKTIERTLNDYPEFILLAELAASQRKCCVEVTTYGPRGCLHSKYKSKKWIEIDEKCYCYR